MGLAKRLRKKYERPLKLWDKQRIARDKYLMKAYALKNKKEIWKAESLLREIRRRARELIGLQALGKGEEERKEFIKRLYDLGLLKSQEAEIGDILELTVEDILKRRLASVVFYNLKLTKSIKQARQLIVHEFVYVGDRRVTSPGYFVKREEEKLITLKREIENGRAATAEQGA